MRIVWSEASSSAWLRGALALARKELRDLAWLALGVAVAVVALAFAAAELYALRLPLWDQRGPATWLGLALLCTVPLAAEVLCADARVGTARSAQRWPLQLGAPMAAKLGALLSAAAAFVIVIGCLSLFVGDADGRPASLGIESLPRVATVALVGTLVTAAVTRHSLAAMLVGIAAPTLMVLTMESTVLEPSLSAAQGMSWAEDALARSYGPVGIAAALALVAWVHAARGAAARSVPRRALRAALGTVGLALAPLAAGGPAWMRIPEAAFDDPEAYVEQVCPSPDGRQLAVELWHGPDRRRGVKSWWLLDPDGHVAPRRLSTASVTRHTGLGTGWRVSLLDWSLDGDRLVGSSMAPRGRGRSVTTWSLDPQSLEVEPSTGVSHAGTFGSWIKRRGVPREVWSFHDGTSPLTLEHCTMLDEARRAPGIALVLVKRRVNVVDLAAGEVRPLDVVLEAGEDRAFLSDDGRWMVRRGHDELTLVELASGRSVDVPGRHSFSWTRRAEPLMVDLGWDYSRPESRREQLLVGLDRRVELSYSVDLRTPIDLDGERWIAVGQRGRRIELLDAEGVPIRTLRDAASEVAE